jgi:hypothetical protein
MTATRIKEIVRELPELLSQQMQALVGRRFHDLIADEKAAYEHRRQRIRELRAELDKIRKAS